MARLASSVSWSKAVSTKGTSGSGGVMTISVSTGAASGARSLRERWRERRDGSFCAGCSSCVASCGAGAGLGFS